jgi:hypothetical protein
VTVAPPAGGDDRNVTMTREQVVELARVDVERSADRIDRIYGWRVERLLTTMRATFILAGSIIGAWLGAVFTGGGQVGKWQGAIAATGLAGSFAATIYQRAQLERLSEGYLQSLRTLRLVQRERGTDKWIHSRSV